MMPITIECPCGQKFSVKDTFARKRARCPACDKPVDVPGENVFVPMLSDKPGLSLGKKTGIAFGAVLTASAVGAGIWFGIAWRQSHSPEKAALDKSYTRALAENRAAVLIFNQAERAKHRGRFDEAVKLYSEFLAHPGSTAFSRHVDDDRRAGRDTPAWLFKQENDERAFSAAVAKEKAEEIETIKKLVRACESDAEPLSIDAFTANFRAMCAVAGINPEDGSSPTVNAFRAVRFVMLQRIDQEKSRIAQNDRVAAPDPGPRPRQPVRSIQEEIEIKERIQARKDEQSQRDFDDESALIQITGRIPPKTRPRAVAVPKTSRPPVSSKPRFSLAAEKLMGQAKALEKSRKLNAAIGVYRHVVKDFPGTEQAITAAARADYLEKP